jgi:alanine-glyoxylate transaminase/serine-glyoxylate transaminase/serine-pyruvate transaminase
MRATKFWPRNGIFSHRWIDMCQRHGLDVHIVETPWGHGLPATEYEAILKADKTTSKSFWPRTTKPQRVEIRHCGGSQKPSTAGHPAMLFVDGVVHRSMDFRMDDRGVDVAVTGSQAAVMKNAKDTDNFLSR